MLNEWEESQTYTKPVNCTAAAGYITMFAA